MYECIDCDNYDGCDEANKGRFWCAYHQEYFDIYDDEPCDAFYKEDEE